MASVLGGDSFCHLTFLRPFQDYSYPVIVQHGDWPLYDLTARVVDIDAVEESEGRLSVDSLRRFETILDLGNRVSNQDGLIRERWSFEGARAKRYNIFFTARNGAWVENLRLLRDGDNWVQAIRVLRNEDVIFVHADPAYPADVSEIEW